MTGLQGLFRIATGNPFFWLAGGALLVGAVFGLHKLEVSRSYDRGVQSERLAWEIERDNLIAANKVKSAKIDKAGSVAAAEKKILVDHIEAKHVRDLSAFRDALAIENKQADDLARNNHAAQLKPLDRALTDEKQIAANLQTQLAQAKEPSNEKACPVCEICAVTLRNYTPSRRLLQSLD